MTSSAESTWHAPPVPWAHWDSTAWASAPSWKEHHLWEDWVSPHPELGHKHPPCHKAAVSLEEGRQAGDGAGGRGGQPTGVRSLGSPEKLVTSLIPSSPFTVIYLGATSSKSEKQKSFHPQHVLWSPQDCCSSFALGAKAACKQLCLPVNKSGSKCSTEGNSLGNKVSYLWFDLLH